MCCTRPASITYTLPTTSTTPCVAPGLPLHLHLACHLYYTMCCTRPPSTTYTLPATSTTPCVAPGLPLQPTPYLPPLLHHVLHPASLYNLHLTYHLYCTMCCTRPASTPTPCLPPLLHHVLHPASLYNLHLAYHLYYTMCCSRPPSITYTLPTTSTAPCVAPGLPLHLHLACHLYYTMCCTRPPSITYTLPPSTTYTLPATSTTPCVAPGLPLQPTPCLPPLLHHVLHPASLYNLHLACHLYYTMCCTRPPSITYTLPATSTTPCVSPGLPLQPTPCLPPLLHHVLHLASLYNLHLACHLYYTMCCTRPPSITYTLPTTSTTPCVAPGLPL